MDLDTRRTSVRVGVLRLGLKLTVFLHDQLKSVDFFRAHVRTWRRTGISHVLPMNVFDVFRS